MKNKNKIFRYLYLLLLCSMVLTSYEQSLTSDPGWFILNGYARNKTGGVVTYNQFNSNSIEIKNVRQIPTTKGKHKVFIIDSNGDHYYKDLKTNERTGISNSDYKISFSGGAPLYMRYYIKYEEDDPPVSITSVNSGSPWSLTKGIPDTLGLSNKSYEGKDAVLIVPASVFNGCSKRYITYNTNLLELSNVFHNSPGSLSSSTTFVYPVNGVTNVVGDKIFLNSTLSNNYYYINFKGKTKVAGQDSIINFNCGCESESSKKAILRGDDNCVYKDTLKDPHDPNFIELISVYKDGDNYYAHYHVECYNNGNESAKPVFFDLDLPSTVDGNDLNLLFWKAGGHIEDDQHVPFSYRNNHLHLEFLHYDHELIPHDEGGPVLEMNKAWFDFSVKINSRDLNEIKTLNLEPEYPYTTFNNNLKFPITLYIEHCRVKDLEEVKEKCERVILDKMDSGLNFNLNNEKPCCCMPKWYWIALGFAVLLILLIVLFRRRQV